MGDLLILNAISHINNMFNFIFLGKKSRTLQTIRRSMASLSARSVFTLRQNINFMVDVNAVLFIVCFDFFLSLFFLWFHAGPGWPKCFIDFLKMEAVTSKSL